ncbi:MAG: carboxypeptidase-like regulatory domain-containing protein [Bacteroidota bacterium]
MYRLVLFFALTVGQLIFSQSTGSVYGKITDGTAPGEPLLFTTVSLKDTPITAQTNFHGNFEITGLEPGLYYLEITYLGYEPKEVAIQVKSGEVALVEASLQAMSTNTENLVLSEATTTAIKTVDQTVRH